MAQSEERQLTVNGKELTTTATVETTGRVIRPFKRLLDPVSDEYRVHLTEEGVAVNLVDAAKVLGVEATLHADAFDQYDTDGTVLGISSKALGRALGHARYGKQTDDAITLDVADHQLRTETLRDIGGTTAYVTEAVPTIDPKSIRQDFDAPELDLGWKAELSPTTFTQALNRFEDGQAIAIEAGDYITLSQSGDDYERNIRLNVTPDGEGRSIFSPGALGKIASGLHNGYADSLTLEGGTQYPIVARFERDGVCGGMYLLAPRIGRD